MLKKVAMFAVVLGLTAPVMAETEHPADHEKAGETAKHPEHAKKGKKGKKAEATPAATDKAAPAAGEAAPAASEAPATK